MAYQAGNSLPGNQHWNDRGREQRRQLTGASVSPRATRVATKPPKEVTLQVRVVTSPQARQSDGIYLDGRNFLRKIFEKASHET